MTDRQLEQRLRAWYRIELEDSAQPSVSMRARVLAIPEATLTRPTLADRLGLPRSWSLVAALFLLLTLMLAGAIAVGSGLLDLPSPDRSTVVPPSLIDNAECKPGREPDAADGPVVSFENRYPSAGFYDYEGRPLGKTTLLFEDGLLLTVPGGRSREQIAAADHMITARHLSPTGVDMFRAAIEASGLVRVGCRTDLHADGPLRGLDVITRAGGFSDADWGNYGFDDPLSPEAVAAAREVERLIEQPTEWLPDEAWIERMARPYVPARWRVQLTIVPPELAWPLERLATGSRPDAGDIVLPGGQPLVAFGIEYQGPEGQLVSDASLTHRCGVVDDEAARAIAGLLNDAGATVSQASWWLNGDPGDVQIHIYPLLPSEEDCPATMGFR